MEVQLLMRLDNTRIIDNSIINNLGHDGGGIYSSGENVIIENNTISDNLAGLKGGGIFNDGGAGMIIDNNVISGNEADYGGGIYNSSHNTEIINNTIDGNNIDVPPANHEGAAIYTYGFVLIENNEVINHTRYGHVAIVDQYEWTEHTQIKNNIVTNNAKGIYSRDGVISGNTVSNNSQWGISGTGTITNNVVENNGEGGISASNVTTFQYNQVVNNGSIGVDLYNSDPTVIFTNNNIYGNSTYDLRNYSGSDINATNNYWGTVVESEIDENIYDYYDDITLGEVIYNPFLDTEIDLDDDIPPTGTISYSTTGPTNGDVIATLTPSESVTVTNNGGSFIYTFTQNESFNFELIDLAGNTGLVTATVTNIDKIAPTATITYSTTDPTNNDVIATLNPSEDVAVTNNGGLFTYIFTDNGSFAFEFEDLAGNTGSATATVTNIDKTPPTVSLYDLPSSPINSTAQSFRVGDDDVISFRYKIDTVDYSVVEELPIRYFHFYDLTEGQHTVYAIGKDLAGNWQQESQATTFTWIIDRTPPIISGAEPWTLYTHPITITYNEGEGWRYTPEDDHILFDSGTTFTADGVYVIWVSDAAGNETHLNFTIDQDPPVISILGDNPYNINLGSSWTDPGATAIDTVDGDITSQITSVSTINTKVAGDYTVTYTIIDGAGHSASAVRNVHVFSENIPTPEPEPEPISTPTPTPKPTPTPEPEPIVLGEETGTPYIVTGTKAGGGPEVRVFSVNGELISHFNAYSDTFRGGINVAVGDMDGDGTMEIITSTRTGGVPTIRVFDMNGTHLGWDFDAYDEGFRGGVNLGVGDIEGDGPYEIAVAPMSGGAPHVRIFGMRNGEIVPTTESFMAYAETFRGGIAISIGDIENDGIGDIITSPTSNGGPHIRIFGVRDRRYVPVTLGTMAYDPSFRGGINSTVGDVNNDGKDEIMTGIVSNGGPHVRIFGVGRSRTFELQSPGFMAYDPSSRGGVEVTSIDINGDGYDEIITGVGGDGSPLVRIFNSEGVQISPEFMAYNSDYKSGITLATGYFE